MSGYIDRLTREAQRPEGAQPGGSLRPVTGSIFSPSFRSPDRVPPLPSATPEDELFVDPSVPSVPEAGIPPAPVPPQALAPWMPAAVPSLFRTGAPDESVGSQPDGPLFHEPASVVRTVRQDDDAGPLHSIGTVRQPQAFVPLLEAKADAPPAQVAQESLPEYHAQQVAPLSETMAPAPPARATPTPLLGFRDGERDPGARETAEQTPEAGLRPRRVELTQLTKETRLRPLASVAAQRPIPAPAPQPVEQPDEIHIHIGRIEVTAAAAPTPQPVAAPMPRRKGPSLAEYLQGRRS